MAFRRALVLAGACAVAATIATPSFAQEKRKLNKDETPHYEALHALVDAVSSGKQPAPADVKLSLHNYFLLSGGDVYIPFTLDLNPAFSQVPVGLYVRAVAKTPPAAASASKGKGKVSGAAPASGATSYAFEDIAFYPEKTDQVNRALELAPGEYDIYVAMSERPAKDKKSPAPKTTVLVQSMNVPNLTSGFATSSIILAKSLEQSNVQLTGSSSSSSRIRFRASRSRLSSTRRTPSRASCCGCFTSIMKARRPTASPTCSWNTTSSTPARTSRL